MSMHSRLAVLADIESLAALAVAMLEDTRPGERYEQDVIRQRIRHYVGAGDAAVWVVERDGAIVGFLLGWAIPFDWRAGCCTVVKMQHILPDARGTEAGDLLLGEFVAWSREQGAEEIVGFNFSPERTAAVRDLLGTEQISDGGALQ